MKVAVVKVAAAKAAVINSLHKAAKIIKAAISKAVGVRQGMPVTIRADAKTPHQAVVTALDATSQLGLTHISLATSKPGDD